MKCLLAVAMLTAGWGPTPIQDPPSALSMEEIQALEQYLHMFTVGPTACGPSSTELIHRYGREVIPYLTKRMIEEPKYRRLCAQLLTSIAGHWGSLDEETEKALVQVLKDGGEGAAYAAWAMGSLCSEAARPELLKASESENPYMVRGACLSLGLIGGEGLRERLVQIQNTWRTKDLKEKKMVLRAAADALDMLAAFEGDRRKESLLSMMKASKSYDGIGWLYSSDYAALRKAIQLNMKELLPDLRMPAKDVASGKRGSYATTHNGPYVYAIYKLGGEVTEDEIKSLRKNTYLLPLRKRRIGYPADD